MNREEVDATISNSVMKVNKALLVFNGLWPYSPRMERIIRDIVLATILVLSILPHILGVSKQCGKNSALCAENIGGLSYFGGCLAKFMVPIISRRKLENLYEKICLNWKAITDPEEQSIMDTFLKHGRFKTIFYTGREEKPEWKNFLCQLGCKGLIKNNKISEIVCENLIGYGIFAPFLLDFIGRLQPAYCSLASFFFSQMTVAPVFLDLIIPLNESRPKMLVTNGEYLFDPFDYYFEVYFAYQIIAITSVSVIVATDSNYTVIIHQSLANFGIVGHRLHKASVEKDETSAYNLIKSAIEMHKQALEFLEHIEATYQLAFMVFIGVSVAFIVVGAIVIVDHHENILDLIRMTLFAAGAMIHIFFISWPGQLVIEHGEELFLATYNNNWYNLPEKAKTLLKIMMMRCYKISFLTAGGFYVMNFENFGAIFKSTVSYMTVALSFD